MDPVWLLLLLPLAAASGWYAASRGHRSTRSVGSDIPQAYFKSLNLLLDEQQDKALDVLISALEAHEETVEIQLALGNLFRRRGEIERATQLHQNLIARSGLEPQQRLLALYELGQDYYKAGLFDRAESLLLEVAEAVDYSESAYRLLLQLYEQEKEWDNAIDAAKRLSSASSEDLTGLLSQYYCELAEERMGAGFYQECAGFIDQALVFERDCTRALILSGRLRAIKNEHQLAIGEWTKIVNLHPEMLPDVVGLVRQSYQSLGRMPDYRTFLERGLELNNDFRLVMTLVDLLVENGQPNQARSRLLSWMRDTHSLNSLTDLIESDAGGGDDSRSDRSLSFLIDLVSALFAMARSYECRNCGFKGKSMHWQCPGCKNWNSTKPAKTTPRLQER